MVKLNTWWVNKVKVQNGKGKNMKDKVKYSMDKLLTDTFIDYLSGPVME